MPTLHVFSDGGSRGNPGPAGIGFCVLQNGKEIVAEGRFLGVKTNNEAEYLALTAAVEWISRFCQTTAVEKVEFNLDSLLVVEQMNKHWKIKEARLRELAESVWRELSQLSVPYVIQHVMREKNVRADELVNQALDRAAATK